MITLYVGFISGNKEQYDKAKYRLTFEELFLLQLGLKSMKIVKKSLPVHLWKARA